MLEIRNSGFRGLEIPALAETLRRLLGSPRPSSLVLHSPCCWDTRATGLHLVDLRGSQGASTCAPFHSMKTLYTLPKVPVYQESKDHRASWTVRNPGSPAPPQKMPVLVKNKKAVQVPHMSNADHQHSPLPAGRHRHTYLLLSHLYARGEDSTDRLLCPSSRSVFYTGT